MTALPSDRYQPPSNRCQPLTLDSDSYRELFRHHAAGVVVITADAGTGPTGFTATSLATVSLDPPLVSFALSTRASSWPTIRCAHTVVVNFLDETQDAIARRFATSGIDRFATPTRWSRLPGGEPALDGAASQLLARVEKRLPAGDHHLVLARATEVPRSRPYPPLVYHHGDYDTVCRPPD